LVTNFQELGATNPEALKGFDSNVLDGIQNNTAVLQTLPPVIQTTAIDAFVHSFHIVFLAAAPVTAIGFLLALLLREVPLRTSADYASAREDAAGESLG
jgi:ABC-type sugar transport system permease subunit